MSAEQRARLEAATLSARLAALPRGEFVGQESFMLAGEIRELAVRAGIGPRSSVLDLCCGVAGPGRLIARELRCTYLGVDASSEAVAIARRRAGPNCRFDVAQVPPLPAGRYDVVLLLETMLAFPDKAALLGGVASALDPGGRFAFTVEEGSPLTAVEKALMPAADTVWPVLLDELLGHLDAVGLRVVWESDCTRAHEAVASSLAQSFATHGDDIRTAVGDEAFDELLMAHHVWSEWLSLRRVRKFAFVAEKVPVPVAAHEVNAGPLTAVLPSATASQGHGRSERRHRSARLRALRREVP